jgi:two-component system cell cycle response regulator CpdR
MTPHSILVVDDEEPIRDLLAQVLQKAGHQVLTVANGREATQAIVDGQFDVVITDLLMPERDGLELITEMRRRFPKIRVIAMTGGGHIPREHYLFVAKNLGAHSLLEKPFEQAQLLAAIEAAVASAR